MAVLSIRRYAPLQGAGIGPIEEGAWDRWVKRVQLRLQRRWRVKSSAPNRKQLVRAMWTEVPHIFAFTERGRELALITFRPRV